MVIEEGYHEKLIALNAVLSKKNKFLYDEVFTNMKTFFNLVKRCLLMKINKVYYLYKVLVDIVSKKCWHTQN